MGLQPATEQLGKGRGGEPGQHLIKHRVAGDLIERLHAPFAGQAELMALSRRQGRGEARDLGDVAAAGEQRHRDQREDRADAEPRVLGPRIGRLSEDFLQGEHLGPGERQHATGRGDDPNGA